MLKPENPWSESGFTLIELLLASVLASLAIFALAQVLVSAGKSIKSFSFNTERKIAEKTFRGKFLPLIESAGVSGRFDRQVLTANCITSSLPCVRKLNSSNVFVDSAPAGLPPTLEFFRDENADLATVQTLITSRNPTLLVPTRAGKPLKIPSSVSDQNYFATWPMVDSTSRPLYMWRSAWVSGSLSYNYAASAGNNLCLDQVTDAGTGQLNLAEGAPIFIYSLINPEHYFLYVATNVTTSSGPCVAGKPAPFHVTTTIVDITNPSGGTDNFFPVAPARTPLAAYTDIATLANTYTTAGIAEPPFAVVPVRATRMYLKPLAVSCPGTYTPTAPCPSGCDAMANGTCKIAYSLMLQTLESVTGFGGTYTPPPSVAFVERLNGTVVFARRLGSQTMSAFFYERYKKITTALMELLGIEVPV
jgi:hypothetical protein